jgi:sialate O-acetylesterase
VVWYAKTITLSAEDLRHDALLKLGPIDDSDHTFINGHLIGKNINIHFKPREYTIKPSLLKEGTNTIIIRIEDLGGLGGFWGKPEEMTLTTSAQTMELAGEWKRKIGGGKVTINHNPNGLPTQLYNAMIHPLLSLNIKGAIWYQGESNADIAQQYSESFPAMIEGWRKAWDKPALPFYYVQLANFLEAAENPQEHEWAELRESQTKTLKLDHTGMAVIIDIGAANDIHPKNKQDVGKRLAYIALHKDYGDDKLEYSGPMYRSHRVEGNKIHIAFDHIGTGLVSHNKYGYINAFAVAGADRKFYWAQAKIDGDQVLVDCPQVDHPVAVRYAWAANPDDVNLYNAEGLPACPFRTDDWPGLTDGKIYHPTFLP